MKKSSALYPTNGKKNRADVWIIDKKQLGLILQWSTTAAYWLIAAEGEVLVVPARHLDAIRRGNAKPVTKTFSVGYHEVRSAAIPLEQYLVSLVIGQWVGTTYGATVRFAKGENANIRPRMVVEVTVVTAPAENNDLVPDRKPQ